MLRDLFSLFPAYAGVILDIDGDGVYQISFPRICGGDPKTKTASKWGVNFSPHMRG